MSSDTSEVVALIPTPATAPQSKTPSEIHETLSSLFREGDAIMVSHLRINREGMAKNAFASIGEAAKFAENLDQDPVVTNIYVNLQQLKPGSTTDKRQDVGQYVRFLVDIDRTVKSLNGVRVNASEEERSLLRKAADEVSRWVSGILGSHPFMADSGNGFHLSWTLRPDMFGEGIVANGENKTTYKECLLAIKRRFDSDSIEIDPSLSEPEQIIRLWGTYNRRDPQTPGRPHRQSHVLAKARGTVSLVQLELLACEYQAPANDPPVGKGDAPQLHEDFDEAAWWGHYSDIFVCEQERDGWQVTSICPATYEGPESVGHRHTGSTLTGFRFGRYAEFHCFSDDHCDMTFGQVLRHLNQYYAPFPGKIWDWGEEDFSDFAEPADAAPGLVPVKPNGHDESYNKKGTACPTCGSGMIGGAFDNECRSCMRKAAIKAARVEGEVELTSGTKDGGCVALNIIEAHTVRTEELEWLWPGRIPAFKVALFAGLGDCLKSTVLIDLVARITTGKDFPDGSPNKWGPRKVLLAITEDDASDTAVPKLIAAEADLTLVKILSMVTVLDAEGKIRRRNFNLKDDMKLLEKALRENPDIALVALDPITGFYGNTDSNADKDMRPMFIALKELCSRTKTALVSIIHLNKKSELNAIQRVSGAGSITNVTRAVWIFSEDPENKAEFFMSRGKNNLAPRSIGGLKYSTVSVPMTFSDGNKGTSFKIEWLGATDLDADEVAQKAKEARNGRNGRDTKVGKAKRMLLAELTKGPKLATEMYRKGKDELGADKNVMKDAKWALGILCSPAPGPFYWSLPGTSAEPLPPEPSEVL
jgi:putative DNA primase/helicase